MKILITGGTGFVGGALVARLRSGGHEVCLLSRAASGPDTMAWSPAEGRLDPAVFAGVEAVVHLAGESILGRWTAEKKRRIRESRVLGTRLLCRTLAGLDARPRVLVSASGINIYPADGELHDEYSAHGSGFLSSVCEEWEAETRPAQEAGMRVVNLRIGAVLGRDGGMVAQLLPVFRAGMGGPVGSGRQHLSWIALEDLVAVIGETIRNPVYEGPVNAVAPGVVSNRELATVFGRVLRRPAIFRAPAFALRLAMGQVADETALADLNIDGRRLRDGGFAFRYPGLEGALRAIVEG